MDTEKISKFIKDIRIKNHLTQKELADKLNVTYQAVSKWENEKSIPDIAILKEISHQFNVSIDELINGEYKNAKTKKRWPKMNIVIVSILIIIIFVSCFYFCFIKNHSDFEFKTISTDCKNFNITGSAAYNKDKTAIYISNIEFCGDNETQKYTQIECNLYELFNENTTLISSCKSQNNITLPEFLEELKINVDNYNSMCKKFSESTVILEIKAYNTDYEITSYNIPINLKSNCE